MQKILAAFVLGVAVTIGVFYALDERGPHPTSDSSAPKATVESHVERRAEEMSLVPAIESESPSDQDRAPPSIAVNSGNSAPSTESASFPSSNGAIAGVSGADRSRVSKASAGTSSGYRAPDEIAAILKDKVPDKLHEQYESESKEESWSTYMEGQIAAYLTSKPALLTFEIALVDCRTSICEIHAIGYGPKAYAVWTNEIADMTEQNWFEFTGMSGSASNAAPDIIGIVVVLHKNNG